MIPVMSNMRLFFSNDENSNSNAMMSKDPKNAAPTMAR